MVDEISTLLYALYKFHFVARPATATGMKCVRLACDRPAASPARLEWVFVGIATVVKATVRWALFSHPQPPFVPIRAQLHGAKGKKVLQNYFSTGRRLVD